MTQREYYQVASVTVGNGDVYTIYSSSKQDDYLLIRPDGTIRQGGGGVFLEVIKTIKENLPVPPVSEFASQSPSSYPGVERQGAEATTSRQFSTEGDLGRYVFAVPSKPSSLISSAAHDVIEEEMRIDLTNGKSYIYKDVPRWKFWRLIHSDSPGKYYNNFIKGTHIWREDNLSHQPSY